MPVFLPRAPVFKGAAPEPNMNGEEVEVKAEPVHASRADLSEVIEIESDASDSISSSSASEDLLSEPEQMEEMELGEVCSPHAAEIDRDSAVATNFKSRIVHLFDNVSFEHFTDLSMATDLLNTNFEVVRIKASMCFRCKICYKTLRASLM